VRYSPHLLAEGGTMQDRSMQESSSKGNFKSASAAGVCRVSAGADAEAVLAAVTAGLRRGSSNFGVTVNQILCGLSLRPDWAVLVTSHTIFFISHSLFSF